MGSQAAELRLSTSGLQGIYFQVDVLDDACPWKIQISIPFAATNHPGKNGKHGVPTSDVGLTDLDQSAQLGV